jgi:hypothetical protein
MVRLRISHKLTLALAALLLATVAVAAVGISSLGDVDRRARALYDDNVRTTQATSAVGGGLSEVEETHQAQVTAEATHRAARSRILLLSAGAVLVWLVIALALVRDLVPRLQAYSRFAARVADGHLGERLTPGGADEVAELGRTLDLMVGRQERRRDYEASQAELADTMQLSETEVEPHDLLRRHLERAIQDSRVTVLNRNHSADRLEPATPVEPECPLTASLQGAKSRSCLAIRFGRVHQAAWTGSRCSPARSAPSSRGSRPASRCWSAARSSGRCWSTTPARPRRWGRGSASRSPRRRRSWPTCATWPSPRSGRPPTPSPACPTTGRSRTPSSGWSPRRRGAWLRCRRPCSTWTTSSTSTTPTATAAATRSWPPWPPPCAPRCVRATSSAATAARSSSSCCPTPASSRPRVVAEKVRAAVDAIALSNLDLRVTASFGVATLPDDCGDADSLMRAADRALYSAKGRGRNRVELFESREDTAPAPAPSMAVANPSSTPGQPAS